MADTNQMKAADFAKVSEVDFVEMFNKGIKVLQEVLGITRKIEKVPGQVIKTYKVTGTLESGEVAEGEEIPLSKYKTEVAGTFELSVKKYRKQVTLEAINDKGYEQAVTDTDEQMVKDIQGLIRKDFFAFLPSGTGRASGVGLQGALAATWGQLKVLFEDYEVADADFIYMVNPLDIAPYLADKDTDSSSCQSKRRCAKTEKVGLETAFSNSYQSKRRCAKTNGAKSRCVGRSF